VLCSSSSSSDESDLGGAITLLLQDHRVMEVCMLRFLWIVGLVMAADCLQLYSVCLARCLLVL